MAEPITDAEIAELAELEKRATPGPWHTGGIAFPDDPVLRHTSVWGPREHPDDQSGRWIDRHITEANANLVCATRNALPRLLARIAELEGENDKLHRSINQLIHEEVISSGKARELLGMTVEQQREQSRRWWGLEIGVDRKLAMVEHDLRRARALLADSGEE